MHYLILRHWKNDPPLRIEYEILTKEPDHSSLPIFSFGFCRDLEWELSRPNSIRLIISMKSNANNNHLTCQIGRTNKHTQTWNKSYICRSVQSTTNWLRCEIYIYIINIDRDVERTEKHKNTWHTIRCVLFSRLCCTVMCVFVGMRRIRWTARMYMQTHETQFCNLGIMKTSFFSCCDFARSSLIN